MEIPSLSLQRKEYEVKAILAQEDSVSSKGSRAPKTQQNSNKSNLIGCVEVVK